MDKVIDDNENTKLKNTNPIINHLLQSFLTQTHSLSFIIFRYFWFE